VPLGVERTFGWLMRYRRLVRDYERRTEHHEAMVYWATVMDHDQAARPLPGRHTAAAALGR
jgi:transposase